VSSRKEQKEALRREREERERQAREAERRKRLVGYGVGGALALAVLVAVVVVLVAGGGGGGGEAEATKELLPDGGKVPARKVTDLKDAARAGDCTLETERARSRDHTRDPAQPADYPSNPPTSGRHFEVPARDGAYSTPPSDPEVVHSLEHGRVILWFKPNLPEERRAAIKAMFDREQGYQLLLVPRRDMPFQLAASAWSRDPEPLGTGHRLGCKTATDRGFDSLQAFVEEYRGNGPEPVP
jgi:hypothetical protein